jgi:6-phosphogluconolactonase/glucosamine-6-phosphate isomerase/deaminase
MAVGLTVMDDDDVGVGQPVELVASRQEGLTERDSYERALGDALIGDRTLFAREDYVEEAWRIVDDVLHADTPLHEYQPGSWGPLGLSGGRTPAPMYRALVTQDVAWELVHIVQIDERVVPLGDTARNLTAPQEALTARVCRRAQVHPMPVDEDDLAAAGLRYGALHRKGAGVPPVLDVAHLGLGTGEQTASQVPGDPVFSASDDVAIAGVYARHQRVTLTYPVLNRARAVLWLVTGTAKAEVLRRLASADMAMPAGGVGGERALIPADRDAAVQLTAPRRSMGERRHPDARTVPWPAIGVGDAAGLDACRMSEARAIAARRPRVRSAGCHVATIRGRGDDGATHLVALQSQVPPRCGRASPSRRGAGPVRVALES